LPSTLTVEYVHSPVKYVQWSSPNSAKPVTSGPPRASRAGHAYEQDIFCAGAARAVAARARRAKVECMMWESGEETVDR
jgi:hypothetical protein